MNTAKTKRALKQYGNTGHVGSATIGHIERNIEKVWEGAKSELTGVQFGKLMQACNQSYHDGQAQATKMGEVWAFDNVTDFLAGIGQRDVPDGMGGFNNQAVLEVSETEVKITCKDGRVIVYTRASDKMR